MRWYLAPLLVLSVAAGWAQEADLKEELRRRAGAEPRFAAPDQAKKTTLPPGVSLAEPLSGDEAVAIALWNNSAFLADLSLLGLARADLVEAGLLRNPSLYVLLPVDPKPFELFLTWPLEHWWQRPRRRAAAQLNLEVVANNLIQNGLDLARDCRMAHAALVLHQQRAKILAETASLAARIAELTQRRRDAGDASAREVAQAQLAARAAQHAALDAQADISTATERLRMILGLRGSAERLQVKADPVKPAPPAPLDQLLEKSFASRPDLRALELAVQAAVTRARWERSRMASLYLILSSKGIGDQGVKTGPGVGGEIPIFYRNQGGIRRADAEVERATLQYLAQRDRVEREVREARAQLEQALEALRRVRGEIVPAAERAVRLAEQAHTNGDISLFDVLATRRPLLDGRLREVEAETACRRALIELERSTGTKP